MKYFKIFVKFGKPLKRFKASVFRITPNLSWGLTKHHIDLNRFNGFIINKYNFLEGTPKCRIMYKAK